MNIEELRDYCLSLGGVDERFPFAKIAGGENVLVFYVCNHMFAFLDISDYDLLTIKCQTERIEELREQFEWADKPSHENGKYWLGLHINITPTDLAKELITNSYRLVKEKYEKKKPPRRSVKNRH